MGLLPAPQYSRSYICTLLDLKPETKDQLSFILTCQSRHWPPGSHSNTQSLPVTEPPGWHSLPTTPNFSSSGIGLGLPFPCHSFLYNPVILLCQSLTSFALYPPDLLAPGCPHSLLSLLSLLNGLALAHVHSGPF